MDFESLVNASGKKGKKRIAATEASLGENTKPVKRSRKTTTNRKRATQQIIIEPTEDQVHSPILATEGTEEHVLRSVHQVKFSDPEPEMVFSEPSCPLPRDARITGS
uniref:Uncharacterized protein n=1 Tax=Cannabis sativa TaxID=3483 RepID=A0A803P987_CANSA